MIKKLPVCLFAFIMVFGIGLNAALKDLIILHTNDVHGHIIGDDKRGSMGMAKISYYAKSLKAEGYSVLMLNAGDAVTGTPISEYTEGVAVYDIMSKVGYDVGTLGNHEFDKGWEHINTYLSAAKFPIVCANAYSPEDSLLADSKYIIKKINGLKVCIVGLVTADVPTLVMREKNEGIEVRDEVKTLKALIPKLRKKCDIMLLLTHTGHDEDITIADKVKGVDLVVGGHSHTDLDKPVTSKNGTRIVQAHEFTKALGEIDLTYDTQKRKITRFKWKKLRGSDIDGTDKEIEKAISLWKRKLPSEMYSVIGHVPREYNRAEFKRIVENFLAEANDADFGYMNKGGVRDKLYYPDIQERDVWIAMPFDNLVSVVSIKGKNIGGVLKTELQERGVNLNDEKTYTVATNTFVSENPGPEIGEPVEKVEVSSQNIRQFVIDSIRANPEVAL
ncbi:bifunctional UDP-sugar hydrolase/5'-nucleotidase [Lentisphaerota bacterium ZTH]|nr:bifunctional metallophosphatase/5'-nucleotidase [Lentisphaerota bacterium]WET05719.1 bifunctional UDP-sugar hydrolase/5'-nucleotidase [Lentisphaerota bacterium ZTH]